MACNSCDLKRVLKLFEEKKLREAEEAKSAEITNVIEDAKVKKEVETEEAVKEVAIGNKELVTEEAVDGNCFKENEKEVQKTTKKSNKKNKGENEI